MTAALKGLSVKLSIRENPVSVNPDFADSEGFAFVLDTRSLAVAYGYVAGYLLVFFENVSVFDFSVADSCPAAVKTYALGEEN